MLSQPKVEPVTAPGLRRYRLTVRARFALTYSLLLTGAGAVMLTLIYVFMRFVPTYDFMLTDSTPADLSDSLPLTDAQAVLSGGEQSSAAISTPASDILISSPDQLFNLLLIVSIVVLVVLALVGIGVGWAAAGRMLRPLQHINEAVSQATKGDLSHRIALVGPRDEISELEVFDRLRQTNERSIQTVEALLGLAQIEETVSADLEPVDLNETLRQAVELSEQEATEQGVTITLDLEGGQVLAEPVLLRQLCTNLVHNSIRHNLAPDGTVTIRTRPGRDSANAESTAVVILEVENTGAVLDPEWVQSLTEPFTRSGGRAASSKTRGHGLGLPIVAAIVRRFQGSLVLSAMPAGGLHATVELTAANPRM